MQELKEASPRQDNFGSSDGSVVDDSGHAFTSTPPPVVAAAAQRRVGAGDWEGEVNPLLLVLLLFSSCFLSIDDVLVFY